MDKDFIDYNKLFDAMMGMAFNYDIRKIKHTEINGAIIDTW